MDVSSIQIVRVQSRSMDSPSSRPRARVSYNRVVRLTERASDPDGSPALVRADNSSHPPLPWGKRFHTRGVLLLTLCYNSIRSIRIFKETTRARQTDRTI